MAVLLGLFRYQHGAYGSAKELAPEAKPEIYCEKYRLLVDLGFQPLGSHWEMICSTLANGDWVFGSVEHHCMAAIMFFPYRNCAAFFITVHPKNHVVITCDFGTLSVHEDQYDLLGDPGLTVVELFEEHKRRMGRLLVGDHNLPSCNSMEDFDEMKLVHFLHPVYKRRLQEKARRALIERISFLLVMISFGGVVGFMNLLPWLMVIGVGVVLKVAKRYYPNRFDIFHESWDGRTPGRN